jgi:hypothetical protein
MWSPQKTEHIDFTPVLLPSFLSTVLIKILNLIPISTVVLTGSVFKLRLLQKLLCETSAIIYFLTMFFYFNKTGFYRLNIEIHSYRDFLLRLNDVSALSPP